MTDPNSKFLFEKNLTRRIIDISVQVEHAVQKNIDNVAKSGYFRAAITLGCTIVEGLLFKLVEDDISNNHKSMGKYTSYKYPHNIPPNYSDKKIVLCFQQEEDIPLTNMTTFSDLIKYAQDNSLISDNEAKKIDFVRKLRNRIHLQSLEEKDRGYTKGKLNKVFDAINILMKK